MDSFTKNLWFNEETCEMFTSIIRQDELNIRVLFYIAQCEKKQELVTVKSIIANVKVVRRVAVKNSKNKLVSFSNTEGFIHRKTAEKIVDRLAYASLIYFDVQRPYKFIYLTQQGIQVAINIHKKMEGNI